jgi:hypothetical protein
MKRFLLIIVLFLIQISIYAQKTVEKKEYWDVWKLKPKTIWHELGDGTKHGIEKVFYENDGTLFSKKTYDYGKLLNYTKYFQDGSINILRNNNKEGKAHGVQQCYEFNKGTRWLKANAKVDNDKLLEYSEYYLPNKPKLLLLTNGVKKEFSRFDEEGNKIAYLNIENGKLSGYTDSHIIFKDNQFESIKINGLTLQKEGRFYYVKIDEAKEDESPSTGYYVIPDSTSYDFYSEFTYSEYFGIPEFSINLYLVGLKGEEEQSSLQLQYLEYRPTDAFASTFFRYYLKNHLVRDSLYCEYQEGSNFQKKSMEVLFKKDEIVWEKEYWENGNLKSVKEGKVSKSYNENGL